MKKYILLVAAAISLAACNNDDNYVDEPVAAHISATIGQSTVSRASDESWDADDAIGITMSDSKGDRYLNMKYTTSTVDGDFSGSTMYFPNKSDKETITAYYPWSELTDGVKTIDANTRDQADQKAFDFLYAKVENVTGAQPNVDLLFSHMMSKLTLIFKKGNDGTDLSKITSYEIAGLKFNGTFNIATGVCAANGDTETLTITPDGVVNGEALPSLILFPQTVDKVSLKITDSENQEFSCELKFTDNSLVSGNNYQFNITVKKTGLVLTKFGIEDWNPIKNGGENEEDPVAGSSD